MYLVLGMKTDIDISVMGNIKTLDLSWAEGMVGCMPIFKDIKSAEKYAEGLEIRVVKLGETK